MPFVCTNERLESQSHNQVTLCMENDGCEEPFEISAGTICSYQMTPCRINRYKKGANNPLGHNFPVLTFAVHGVILQDSTDLWIQMTTARERLVRLHITHNYTDDVVQHVSIGQKCQARWDFRKLAVPALHGTHFEIRNDQSQHIATLIIMLDFISG